MKKNKNVIARITILVLVSSIAVFVDFKFKISSTTINTLVSVLFTAVTVIAGIWIASYLLFLQLYKDRYPIKVVKEKYLPHMRDNFIMVVYVG